MSKLPPNACRLRVRYKKDGRLAYLGHLEVMNTIMRCVRRSGIRFEVGNGFARRMRIQFSQALPVGAASEGEYYDLLLDEPINERQALDALIAATPQALVPNAARILPRRMPALEAWANRSRWDVVLQAPGLDAAAFLDGVGALQEAGELRFMRGDKHKRLDLRNTLVSYEARDEKQGVHATIDTRSTEEGALRPAILANAAVGCLPLRVCRVGQWHEEADGSLSSPLPEPCHRV